MAGFQLNFADRSAARQVKKQHPYRVRIGALSVFALTITICLAVLAVLSFTTSNASLTMAERQAAAESQRYLDEVAAQEFVAGVDAALAPVRGAGDARAAGKAGAAEKLSENMDGICAAAAAAASGKVKVEASVEGNAVNAQFEGENGRQLNVVLEIGADATYQVRQWSMSAVQNQEQPEGQLLIID